MRLKKVEITGFKSFMDRTRVLFEPGVTAVVGPNGCGKSNIVDAIRWAMGEHSAKTLRGRVMDDVIFNGSDVHRPLGMAEVTITFENANGNAPSHLAACSEIEVSRRLFRCGESEYTINRVPCRRRDVWELFMDTGLGNRSYAIVEQDRISRIIQARPEERRVVIEEVAGISKYKSRREAAQRKMEATRQNLLRIQDIRREVAQQIQGLERQAKKAARFRQLRSDILQCERHILLSQWLDQHQQRISMEEECRTLEDQRDEFVNRLHLQETALEEERLLALQEERSFQEAQEFAFQLAREVQALEGRLQGNLQEIERLESIGELLRKESEQMGEKIQAAREEMERWQVQRGALEEEKRGAEGRAEEIKAAVEQLDQGFKALVGELEECKSQLVEALSERATLRNSLGHYERQIEEMTRFLERHKVERRQLEDQLAEVRQAVGEVQARIDAGNERFQALQESRSTCATRIQEAELRDEEHRAEMEEVRLHLQEARSRLGTLEELQHALEGFGDGMKAFRDAHLRGEVLADKPLKILAETMEVREGGEAAVEGLLGERLQYMVVGTIEEALEALLFSRERGLGRVGFVPLRSDAQPQVEREAAGLHQGIGEPLTEEVQWEHGYESLARTVLGDIRVVADPQEAVTLLRSKESAPLVTRHGDVLYPEGIMEGGERQGANGGYLMRKREIRHLRRDVAEMAARESKLRGRLDDLAEELAALRREMEQLEQETRGTQIELTEAHQDLKATNDVLRAKVERMEVLEWELKERTDEMGQIRRLRESEMGRLGEVESQMRALEKSVQDMEARRLIVQSELESLQHELTQSQVRSASVGERCDSLAREMQRLERRLVEISDEKARKDRQVVEGVERADILKKGVEGLRRELQGGLQRHEGAQHEVQELRRTLEERRSRILENEKSCHQARREQRAVEETLQERRLQHKELMLRAEHLEGELTGRLEMDRGEIPSAAEALPEKDPVEMRQALGSLRSSLERLGEVNLMAVEQYEELKQRYDFLTTQQEDLEESIRSLNKAIQKINRTSRRRFKEAFAALNAHFQRVFPILFKGGEAQLVLTEAADVLDAGVEIVARPPGKRLQSISLLSGGEMALTAVALIFAMILIKPTPFCLLDEVDAPLDDANIERFTAMVKELSSDSQFILVTHNKRTMEMADALCGVTMETPGVSKLISVKLQ